MVDLGQPLRQRQAVAPRQAHVHDREVGVQAAAEQRLRLLHAVGDRHPVAHVAQARGQRAQYQPVVVHQQQAG